MTPPIYSIRPDLLQEGVKPVSSYLNAVIDLSHHNKVESFHDVAASGVMGVILKASEGVGYSDDAYKSFRDRARSVGLLTGAYHFATDSNAQDQAEYFLKTAAPDSRTLLVLDWEEYGSNTMSKAGAEAFVQRIHAETGRYPGLYSGQSFLWDNVDGDEQPILSECWLWIARYSTELPEVPPAWPTWSLWQHTNGQTGAEPHECPGIGPCDRDKWNGTADQLVKLWTS